MKLLRQTVALGVLLSVPAWADWNVVNRDAASYELKTRCGSSTQDWWISGNVTKPSSIPEGHECVVTMKKGGSRCAVKNGQTCVIKSGRLRRA